MSRQIYREELMFKKAATLIATLCALVALTALGVSTASAAPAKANIGGGTGILVDKDKGTASACTLTAIGRDQNNILVGLTAGHCGPAGKAVFVEAAQGLGPVGQVTFTHRDLDYAIIRFDSAKVNPVQRVGGVTIRGIRTQAPAFPEIGCKQGRTTANTCGITWFSDGSAHTSQICVVEGDSGSPVVVGDRLVGMVNAYYFIGCIGPETGTNIKPILDDLPARGITAFHVV
ncbi:MULTISPECIES: serine protease [Actinomycetes]|uniref:serine protease n=1 Tax=Actinomycetes TaxID=1760 RepID=UPI0018CC521E|nr:MULTISPECIES: serine protease [Actinomycetes]